MYNPIAVEVRYREPHVPVYSEFNIADAFSANLITPSSR